MPWQNLRLPDRLVEKICKGVSRSMTQRQYEAFLIEHEFYSWMDFRDGFLPVSLGYLIDATLHGEMGSEIIGALYERTTILKAEACEALEAYLQDEAPGLLTRGGKATPSDGASEPFVSFKTEVMVPDLPEYKRRALEKRRVQLLEEYDAIMTQLASALDPVTEARLKRQAVAKEQEIREVETELGVSAAAFTASRADVVSTTNSAPVPPSQGNETPALLKIQLLQQGMEGMQVRGLRVPGRGEPKADVPLPFTVMQLKAVLKALDVGAFVPVRFKPEYVQALSNLGLLTGDRLHAEFHKRVGQKLYAALFSGAIGTELAMAVRNPPVACQLCFDEEDTVLAQFPWELVHNGAEHPVVVQKGLELTRYITYGTAPSPLKVTPPLNVLFIAPRGKGDAPLDQGHELSRIKQSLEPLQQSGKLTWSVLDPPTWEALEEALNSQVFHIVHFDGHGTFARVCPACGEFHYPSSTTCSKCDTDMQDAPARGYLHFESSHGQVDPVAVEDLTVLFQNSEARLVVLSSCNSAVTQGVSVFNGVAPGLIRAGIPAVLGMQGSPTVGTMAKFFARVYEMLAGGTRLPEAVSSGRRAIYRDKPLAWFMPVVYLRSSDETYGQLFTP